MAYALGIDDLSGRVLPVAICRLIVEGEHRVHRLYTEDELSIWQFVAAMYALYVEKERKAEACAVLSDH